MHIALVCAADDRFAMPLAVTLFSALSRLNPSTKADVFVLDGGITKKNCRKIKETLLRARADTTINFVTPRLEELAHLIVSHHISVSTYLRLQVADLLPSSVSRAIYLDCDLIILHDLTSLWTTPLGEFSCGATRDFAFPVVSAARAIEHWEGLGLHPQTPYFNAGVMLIDLKRWREESTGAKVVTYLTEMGDRNNLGDQGGLNAILAGQVKLLDPRWNVSLSSLSMYDEAVHDLPLTTLHADPWIIHYTSRWKPWHVGALSMDAQTTFYYNKKFRREFFITYLRSGWRNRLYARGWVGLRAATNELFALGRRLGVIQR